MATTITEKILAQRSCTNGRLEDLRIAVDIATGTIDNRTTNKQSQARSFPPFMQELISAGGLIPYY